MSLNKVLLIGNVGKDPEVRYFGDGKAVANFTLATNERGYTTSNGIQIPERTEWHNITLWRGLAEIAEKFIKKGSKIYIEGKIRTRSYDDAQGVKKNITEITGDNIVLLDRKPTLTESEVKNTTYSNHEPVINQTFSSSSDKKEDENDDLPF